MKARIGKSSKGPEDSLLIQSLIDNSICGLAMLDDHFRYVRINNTLAKMNGFPVDFHIGKTLREVLGEVATEIERQLASIFSTGKRVDNHHLVAKLPTRVWDSEWNVSYIPMKDDKGKVTQVCTIVMELERDHSRDRYYRKQTSPTARPDAALLRHLTKRQVQVIQYLASGKSNKEIAATLNITVRTVESYRTRVMEKLGIHSLVDLVRFAIRHGITDI